MTARLVGLETPNKGRLEVKYNEDPWGTVCDDVFDMMDANVACKMLGYTEAEMILSNTNEEFLPHVTFATTEIVLDDLACTGEENTLLACGRRGLGQVNCGHHEDVLLVCKAPREYLPIISVLKIMLLLGICQIS